jgi:hypothetical protein
METLKIQLTNIFVLEEELTKLLNEKIKQKLADEGIKDSTRIMKYLNIDALQFDDNFEDDFLKSKTYTGTININDNIFIFMEAIRRTSVQPVEYKFNKNVIYVKLKK